MKSIYLSILTVVMNITVASGIFDKTICWLIVTGELKDFLLFLSPSCIYTMKNTAWMM